MLSDTQRKETYFALSSQIAQLDNQQLVALFARNSSTNGWGKNQTLEIGGAKVFVKRVPMTDLEYQNLFSTRNLYDLPMYYNYGVGSAGFGVFRELIAHIKTTNWVLSGEISSFPLLYAYRIVPFTGERSVTDAEPHKGYMEFWGGSESVGRYLQDRRDANHELVLFLEFIPHVLRPWLAENTAQTPKILSDLFAAVDFLRKNNVIHFDAHYDNILTDGERAYLTDFGLVLDKNYLQTDSEKEFFSKHIYYDYGEIIASLIFIALRSYDSLSDESKTMFCEKYGIQNKDDNRAILTTVLKNIDDISASGILKLEDAYCACLVKYRKIILLIDGFFTSMHGNNAKDTEFPSEELLRLLLETGVVRS